MRTAFSVLTFGCLSAAEAIEGGFIPRGTTWYFTSHSSQTQQPYHARFRMLICAPPAKFHAFKASETNDRTSVSFSALYHLFNVRKEKIRMRLISWLVSLALVALAIESRSTGMGKKVVKNEVR